MPKVKGRNQFFFLSTHLHPLQVTCLEPCTCLRAKIIILNTTSSFKIHAWSFVMAKREKNVLDITSSSKLDVGASHMAKRGKNCFWPSLSSKCGDSSLVHGWIFLCYWPLTFNIESRRPKRKKISFGHAWSFQALQWAWLRVILLLLVLFSNSELHSLELESKAASKTLLFWPLVLALKEGGWEQEFSFDHVWSF